MSDERPVGVGGGMHSPYDTPLTLEAQDTIQQLLRDKVMLRRQLEAAFQEIEKLLRENAELKRTQTQERA